MGFPKSRTSQHESVLESRQLGPIPMKVKTRTVLRCCLNGDRHFHYRIRSQETPRCPISRRVMVSTIEGWVARHTTCRREHRSASRSRQLPPTFTRTTPAQLGVRMSAVEELSAKDAVPHTLLKFLQSQPRKALSRLYQRPSSCLCIFRFLLYSCPVETGSADAWGNCCSCPKITWATRKADCYEYSLVGCFYTCFYNVFLGRARGEKVSLLNRSL